MADGITINVKQPDPLAAKLDLAKSAIMFVYSAFMAWQMAKMVCPGLEVHEKILVEKISRKFRKPGEPTQRDIDEFVAEVTQYVRSQDG